MSDSKTKLHEWRHKKPQDGELIAVYFNDKPTPLFGRAKFAELFVCAHELSEDGVELNPVSSDRMQSACWCSMPEPPNWERLDLERRLESLRAQVRNHQHWLEVSMGDIEKLERAKTKL